MSGFGQLRCRGRGQVLFFPVPAYSVEHRVPGDYAGSDFRDPPASAAGVLPQTLKSLFSADIVAFDENANRNTDVTALAQRGDKIFPGCA